MKSEHEAVHKHFHLIANLRNKLIRSFLYHLAIDLQQNRLDEKLLQKPNRPNIKTHRTATLRFRIQTATPKGHKDTALNQLARFNQKVNHHSKKTPYIPPAPLLVSTSSYVSPYLYGSSSSHVAPELFQAFFKQNQPSAKLNINTRSQHTPSSHRKTIYAKKNTTSFKFTTSFS